MSLTVYETMAPAAQDVTHDLLCKAAYYLQAAAESASVTAANAMYANMTPFAQDTEHDLIAKLAYWASQIAAGGGGGGSGVDNQALAGATPTTSTKFFVFDTNSGFLWYNSGTLVSPTWNNV